MLVRLLGSGPRGPVRQHAPGKELLLVLMPQPESSLLPPMSLKSSARRSTRASCDLGATTVLDANLVQ